MCGRTATRTFPTHRRKAALIAARRHAADRDELECVCAVFALTCEYGHHAEQVNSGPPGLRIPSGVGGILAPQHAEKVLQNALAVPRPPGTVEPCLPDVLPTAIVAKRNVQQRCILWSGVRLRSVSAQPGRVLKNAPTILEQTVAGGGLAVHPAEPRRLQSMPRAAEAAGAMLRYVAERKGRNHRRKEKYVSRSEALAGAQAAENAVKDGAAGCMRFRAEGRHQQVPREFPSLAGGIAFKQIRRRQPRTRRPIADPTGRLAWREAAPRRRHAAGPFHMECPSSAVVASHRWLDVYGCHRLCSRASALTNRTARRPEHVFIAAAAHEAAERAVSACGPAPPATAEERLMEKTWLRISSRTPASA